MSAANHTPGKWKFGVRKDGSMWLSLGDPTKGPHYQGDLVASVEDAYLIAAAPELLAAAHAAIAYDKAIMQCADDPSTMSSFCTAQGDTLDTLYAAWISASRAAIAKATGTPAKDAA